MLFVWYSNNMQQAGEQFFCDFSRGYCLCCSCHFCAIRAAMWLSLVTLVSLVRTLLLKTGRYFSAYVVCWSLPSFLWILLLNVQRVGFMVCFPKKGNTLLNVLIACIKTKAWFTVQSLVSIVLPAKFLMSCRHADFFFFALVHCSLERGCRRLYESSKTYVLYLLQDCDDIITWAEALISGVA